VRAPGHHAGLKELVGAGDRIGLFVLPVLVVGVAANVVWPEPFSVGGPSRELAIVSIVMLLPGVLTWLWSVALILVKVPRGELITTGPFRVVKHPLYTSVALLVLPAVALLLDTWLGIVLGAALYIASRRYSPAEEAALAATFEVEWDEYERSVLIPWL
jgi:protein-S-isoprenylcysteine O-methyltransferase Ste14